MFKRRNGCFGIGTVVVHYVTNVDANKGEFTTQWIRSEKNQKKAKVLNVLCKVTPPVTHTPSAKHHLHFVLPVTPEALHESLRDIYSPLFSSFVNLN